ncbi:unnamed protein product [Peniophora sp. CBMAI 1063]|nr:unnamed protein product [Peniophora sp. CBMAI 1063]
MDNLVQQTATLSVSVAQSRFHKDANNDPTSKDIDIKDLTLALGQRELLSHADLHLQANEHYVLVGRNGSGKSTLLRALADGQIPGVPSGIRILLLSQHSLEVAGAASKDERDETVLRHVIRSDKYREKLLADQKTLSAAFESSDDAYALVRAERALVLRDLKLRLAEAREVAAYRSGARGIKARKELKVLEGEVQAAETSFSRPDDELAPEEVAQATSAASDRLAAVENTLAAIDSSSADARATLILRGLGFKQEAIDGKFTSLSGGWRTRCLIAGALFQSSDVLLLDEPTNFLDLPAIIWLQTYIEGLSDKTVVAVTHDRAFADAVASTLLVLREQTLTPFAGNLSTYERERHKHAKYMSRMKDAQDASAKHMQSTIERNIQAARRTGDDKKLKQAASRRKKLEERSGLEVSAKGTRFKLNRDLPGFHLTNRAEIEIPKFDPPVKLSLPTRPPETRIAGSLVSLENVSFSYTPRVKPILQEATLVVHPGERIGVVGLNGAGKSTLIRLVLGPSHSDGLRPSRGSVSHDPRARIACFSQHIVEELERRGVADPTLTALREIQGRGDGLPEQQARALLGGLGVSGRTASDVSLAALSGGQKVRVALAGLLVTPPHLLVLDEVTSHLDADTVTALARALRGYQGALLIVSHDRYFVKTVVEGEPLEVREDEDEDESSGDEDDATSPAGRVLLVAAGKLKKLDGGMSEYERKCERISAKLASVK